MLHATGHGKHTGGVYRWVYRTIGSANRGQVSSSDHTTMFPFSYDILSISFALDAMERYYDPEMNSYLAMNKNAFGDTLISIPPRTTCLTCVCDLWDCAGGHEVEGSFVGSPQGQAEPLTSTDLNAQIGYLQRAAPTAQRREPPLYRTPSKRVY